MTTVEQGPAAATDAAQETFIIDGDSHVLEPPHLWDEYLERDFRPRAIRIMRPVEGLDSASVRPGAHAPDPEPDLPEMAEEVRGRLGSDEVLVVDGQLVMRGMLAGLGGVEHHRSKLPQMTYLEGAPRASMDTAARLELFREWGIDGGVVFPTIGILWDTEDARLADAYARAYNRWVHDFAGGPADQIFPMAHIPLNDPDLALAELRRCLKLGFRGMFLAPEPVGPKSAEFPFGDTSPADPVYDPLWHELEDAGLPVCLHVIVRFNRRVANNTRVSLLLKGQQSRVHVFGLGATFQIIPAVSSLVLSGLFDRFPRLKLLAVEAGAGWAAYQMDRLDEKHEMFGYAERTKLAPSEYLRRNVYYVVEPRERTAGAMMDLVGERQFIWGSDYPHIDSSIEAPQQIRASAAGLSEHRRRLLLGENARALFGL
ncbi:MAG: amidohydrolase family protein [Dehalococcoidia bacterium]